MKRRTTLALKPRLRDRRAGRSPYAKYKKRPYKYPWQHKGHAPTEGETS